MFTIEPMPQQLDRSVVELLSRVETATIGHLQHSGFVDPGIHAVVPDIRVAGTAVTVRLPHTDNTMLHHALTRVRPGDFLVVDRCGDRRHAAWGGYVTVVAQLAGIAGVVIDGVATDFSEVRKARMPLWCRGPSPITCKKLGLEGAMNVPVSIGGTAVEPGDAILADESGVVVLKPVEAERIGRMAIEMQEDEVRYLARLRAGERFADMTNATDLIRKCNAAAKA
jgi:4-hydroxy-4-methyl-2-oxoglutarate aldolase